MSLFQRIGTAFVHTLAIGQSGGELAFITRFNTLGRFDVQAKWCIAIFAVESSAFGISGTLHFDGVFFAIRCHDFRYLKGNGVAVNHGFPSR